MLITHILHHSLMVCATSDQDKKKINHGISFASFIISLILFGGWISAERPGNGPIFTECFCAPYEVKLTWTHAKCHIFSMGCK